MLRDLVLTRTGLNFPDSRLPDLEAGIQCAMLNSGATDPEQFAEFLDADQQVFDALISSITVTETYFFREPAQFDMLRNLVLPDLRRHLPFIAQMRVWSAGCASGEEPYSLAILLEQEGLAEVTSILATDISRAVLARARDASYGSWSLRGNAGGDALRCFERRGDRFVLQDRYSRRVTFRYLNLASSTYPAPENGTHDIDLILCRNVLIYFDHKTVRRVARQLYDSLRDGGWLITGPSDPPLWDHAPYRTIVTSAGVFYQRSKDVAHVSAASATAAVRDTTPTLSVAVDDPPIQSVVMAASPLAIMPSPPPAADDPIACKVWVSRVRALADRGASRLAETEADAGLRAHPLSPELHYLHAIVLTELGRQQEAAASLRRVIYLDPTLAMAHFTLGSILAPLGAIAEARRSYQNALDLCLRRPNDEILPLSDDEPAGKLVEASRAQIMRLGSPVRLAP